MKLVGSVLGYIVGLAFILASEAFVWRFGRLRNDPKKAKANKYAGIFLFCVGRLLMIGEIRISELWKESQFGLRVLIAVPILLASILAGWTLKVVITTALAHNIRWMIGVGLVVAVIGLMVFLAWNVYFREETMNGSNERRIQ